MITTAPSDTLPARSTTCSLDVSGPSVGRVGWQTLRLPPSLNSQQPLAGHTHGSVAAAAVAGPSTLTSQAAAATLNTHGSQNAATPNAHVSQDAASQAVHKLREALKQLVGGMAAPLSASDIAARVGAVREQKQGQQKKAQQQQKTQQQGERGLLLGVCDEAVPLKAKVRLLSFYQSNEAV